MGATQIRNQIDERNKPKQSTDEDEEPLASGYPAEKARQGKIILRHRWSRIVFIGALALAVLLAIIWEYFYR